MSFKMLFMTVFLANLFTELLTGHGGMDIYKFIGIALVIALLALV